MLAILHTDIATVVSWRRQRPAACNTARYGAATMAHHPPLKALRVYFIAAFLALLMAGCQGQGLRSPVLTRSAEASVRSLGAKYRSAQAGKAAALARVTARLRSSCTDKTAARARLCATALRTSTSSVNTDALQLGMSPLQYNGRASGNFLSPVKNQGTCATCVPFALAAAAEAVAAKALGISGSSIDLSEQDIGFCPSSKGVAFCRSGADMTTSMARILRPVMEEACLPYTIAPGRDSPDSQCHYRCNRPSAVFSRGKYQVVSLPDSIPNIQYQIRRHGAVVTRLDLYSDFKPFFDKNPRGVYDGKGCSSGDAFTEQHAVVLVGYDNLGDFWIARNSWGPKWADGGYFKIKYGVCSVGVAGETYAVMYTPQSLRRAPLRATADPDIRGCFLFRASPPDTIWSLADAFDVDALELLANNTGVTGSPTDSLGGKLVTLCKSGPRSKFALPAAWAVAPRPAPKLAPRPAPKLAPRPAPKPAPRPAPKPAPRPAPRPASRPVPRPAPRPAPKPAPRRAPAPRRTPAPAPRRAPAPGPRRAPAPRAAPVRRTTPARVAAPVPVTTSSFTLPFITTTAPATTGSSQQSVIQLPFFGR